MMHRPQAFRQFWIWFDSLIVVFGLLELLEESRMFAKTPPLNRPRFSGSSGDSSSSNSKLYAVVQ
eukprot:1383369-Amphidinium_carterae.1